MAIKNKNDKGIKNSANQNKKVCILLLFILLKYLILSIFLKNNSIEKQIKIKNIKQKTELDFYYKKIFYTHNNSKKILRLISELV